MNTFFLDHRHGMTFVNGLQSKREFDNVIRMNEKPSAITEGFSRNNSDSVKSDKMETCDPILSDAPNLYNKNGESMENSGYFIIPKSLFFDPTFQNARIKYQKVLLTILANAAFAATTHAIGTERIKIEKGQLCVTVRGLMDLCNKGVKYKEDMIDKNVVERASHFWRTCGLVRQEVRHGKTLITITIPGFYETKKIESETGFETKPRLNRDIKEEDKIDLDDLIDLRARSGESDFDPKKTLRFKHQKKGFVEKDIESLRSELLTEGWVSQEIYQAIFKMQESNPELSGTIKKYITKILSNARNEKQKEEKCKKQTTKQTSHTETPLSAKSPKDKGFYSADDTSETPLAKFARLNGLK